jgi:hypothetical protein
MGDEMELAPTEDDHAAEDDTSEFWIQDGHPIENPAVRPIPDDPLCEPHPDEPGVTADIAGPR